MKTCNMEEPCKETGIACVWICDEFFDENGEIISWDMYCGDCFCYRDWDLDEYSASSLENGVMETSDQ